jgi:phospholipid-binding lipoprotein MlaA
MDEMFTNNLSRSQTPRGMAATLVLVAALGVSACAHQPASSVINDPDEAANRAAHRFNVKLDRALFGDRETHGLVPTLPRPVAEGAGNFASNLGLPSVVVNDVLQLKLGPALQNTLRFAVNSSLGIGGIFDPAGAIGIDADHTDFGETLHVWGVPEGTYLEVPVLGPSTQRDFAGTLVDYVLDPVNNLVGRTENAYITAGRLTAKVGDRQRFADTYESILYDSADSYAQARLLYLQNRHFELGIEEEAIDPYADPYAN